MKVRNWLILAAVVLLTVLPLWLASAPPSQPGSEAPALFGGSDDRAQKAIGSIAPGYKPWFAPLIEPASSEIASLLFALQAAIGAGVIGYWLGGAVTRERAKRAAASPAPRPIDAVAADTRESAAGSPAAGSPAAASPASIATTAQEHRAG